MSAADQPDLGLPEHPAWLPKDDILFQIIVIAKVAGADQPIESALLTALP